LFVFCCRQSQLCRSICRRDSAENYSDWEDSDEDSDEEKEEEGEEEHGGEEGGGGSAAAILPVLTPAVFFHEKKKKKKKKKTATKGQTGSSAVGIMPLGRDVLRVVADFSAGIRDLWSAGVSCKAVTLAHL
jgi:hypothetical protein